MDTDQQRRGWQQGDHRQGQRHYGYWVRGCNDHGCAGWSVVKSIPVELPGASAPALTVPAQGLKGAYTVSWGAAAGATSFTLEESANGGSWTNAYTGAAGDLPPLSRTSRS